MPINVRASSDFAEVYAVHAALKNALKGNVFSDYANARKAAQNLVREFESVNSAYGRQLKMAQMLEKGATLDELATKLRSSRRTIFRYLNTLEEAGVSIELHGDLYTATRGVPKPPR